MKKLIAMLVLAATFALSSYAFAVQGGDTWYGTFFKECVSVSGTAYRIRTYIGASNPNDTDAVLKVTYYDHTAYTPGTVFANTSSFTHVIPAKSYKAWYPNSDLKLSDSNVTQGTYIIKAETAGVVATGSVFVYAGDSLGTPASGATPFSTGEFIMSYYYPLESTPAKNLYLEGSWQKDTDGQAYTAGDYCGDFYVTNPNDTTAKGKMFIYKNGALLNTGGTSFEINPHDTWITNLYNDFGLHGSGSDVSYGPVVIEVDEGSVIAAGQRKRCSYVNTTSHIPTYEFLWDPFFKTICTQ